jgi:hypothetical protein
MDDAAAYVVAPSMVLGEMEFYPVIVAVIGAPMDAAKVIADP